MVGDFFFMSQEAQKAMTVLFCFGVCKKSLFSVVMSISSLSSFPSCSQLIDLQVEFLFLPLFPDVIGTPYFLSV